MSCAEIAELIKMPFGMLTQVGPRNHVLDGGPEGAILRAKWGQPRTCADMSYGRYIQCDSAVANADQGVLDGGVHWRHHLVNTTTCLCKLLSVHNKGPLWRI